MPDEQTVKEHTKPGLIENAAGSLRCPRCGSDEMVVQEVVYATEFATTTSAPSRVMVQPARGGRLAQGIETVLELALMCQRQHLLLVNVITENGKTAVTTRWDEPDEEAS